MLLARAKIRGKLARTVPAGIDLSITKVFDFSYLPPLSFIDALFTAESISDDGLISAVGARTFRARINAAGIAIENIAGNLFGEAEVGLTPMVPNIATVGGLPLALTFRFNNTSAQPAKGVVIYSFEVTLPDEFSTQGFIDPCFLAGTLVGTPNGLIAIEELKIGQQLYSFDIDNDEIVRSEVAKVIQRISNHYFELVVAGETLLVTGEHPFFVPDLGYYVPMNKLSVGDNLHQIDGPDLRIDRIKLLPENTTVYNLTVDNMHNYFVGKRGLLVHNK